jgi:hypothetical protein
MGDGRAHPLAVCGAATLSCSPPEALLETERNLTGWVSTEEAATATASALRRQHADELRARESRSVLGRFEAIKGFGLFFVVVATYYRAPTTPALGAFRRASIMR